MPVQGKRIGACPAAVDARADVRVAEGHVRFRRTRVWGLLS
jgi:hypothetical protein